MNSSEINFSSASNRKRLKNSLKILSFGLSSTVFLMVFLHVFVRPEISFSKEASILHASPDPGEIKEIRSRLEDIIDEEEENISEDDDEGVGVAVCPFTDP